MKYFADIEPLLEERKKYLKSGQFHYDTTKNTYIKIIRMCKKYIENNDMDSLFEMLEIMRAIKVSEKMKKEILEHFKLK